MKNRTMLAGVLFLLALLPISASAQDEGGQVSGSQLRPDLYIRQLKGTPRSGTLLGIQIANKGNVESLPCTLTIDIYESNAFDKNAMREYLDMKVPAIEPGRTAWVVTEQIETDFVKSDARNHVTPLLPFILTVDSKNDNPEFDKKNNVVHYRAALKNSRKP